MRDAKRKCRMPLPSSSTRVDTARRNSTSQDDDSKIEASFYENSCDITEQSKENESQVQWEDALINEVINDFLKSIDEVDVMLAQEDFLNRAHNIKEAQSRTPRYSLRNSKKEQK